MVKVELHPRALVELRSVRRRYARVDPELATRFAAAFNNASTKIETRPLAQARYLLQTRMVRTKRFPFLLVFVEIARDHMLILAVAHVRRRPGYWRRRLP